MAEVTYRAAATADAEAIASVMAEVVAGPHLVGFERARPAVAVQLWLSRLGESGLILLVESAGEALGFGALDFDTQEPETASLGVWLRGRARRQGIGTRLAEGLLTHARDRGFTRIVDRLPENNEAAMSFLNSIGGLVPIINLAAPATPAGTEMRFELPL